MGWFLRCISGFNYGVILRIYIFVKFHGGTSYGVSWVKKKEQTL